MADGSIRIGLELDKSKIKADFKKIKDIAEKVGKETGKEFEEAFEKGSKGLVDFGKKMEEETNAFDKGYAKVLERLRELQAIREKIKGEKGLEFEDKRDQKKYKQLKDFGYVDTEGKFDRSKYLTENTYMGAEADATMYEKILEKGKQVEVFTEEQKAQLEEIKTEEEQVNKELAIQEEKRANINQILTTLPKLTKEVSKVEQEESIGINWNKLKSGVIKYGTALLGVRGAMGLLRKGVSAFMQQNEQMQNQIKGLWNALGEMLSPAIEKVFNIILKGVAIINAFVKALFGIDFVARANAKALAKQNSAMKKTNDLASFDEMNKMSDSSGSSFKGLELPELSDKQKEFFKFIEEHAEIIKAVLKGLATTIGVLLAYKLITHLDEVGTKLATVFKGVSKIWDLLYTNPIVLIVAIIAGLIVALVELYKNCEPFREWVDMMWGKLKDFFHSIGEWVQEKGKIIDAWLQAIPQKWAELIEKIKNSDAYKTFASIANKIVGAIEWMINKIIDGFNWLASKLNTWKVDIPSWVPVIGGKNFGFNIKQVGKVELPRIALATGGIVNRPTNAIIGENGAEVVMPLEKNTEWIDMLAERLNGNGQIVVNIQLDGKTISKEIRKANERYSFARNGI